MADTLSIIDRPSANFDIRKRPIDTILLHYTAGELKPSLDHLCDPAGTNRVSVHYVVARDGAIYRLVDEHHRAWHAGLSQWKGLPDVNSSSIGIEIINLGRLPDGSFDPYPDIQIDAVIALCRDIKTRHAIKYVLGHSDVAVGRKIDPGAHFPWKRLAEAGLGLWTDDLLPAKLSPRVLLEQIGYDITDPVQAFRAFQRHYYPEGLLGLGSSAKARLAAVCKTQTNP